MTKRTMRMGITKSRAGHYTVSIYADGSRYARRLHSSPLHSCLLSAQQHGREVLASLQRDQAEGVGVFAAIAAGA